VKKKRAYVSWSEEEDTLLKRLKEVKGWSWAKIAKCFPGRTLDSCKMRYSNNIHEGEKRAAGVMWSEEEDMLLKRLKEEEG
jgi:hypothetical protein